MGDDTRGGVRGDGTRARAQLSDEELKSVDVEKVEETVEFIEKELELPWTRPGEDFGRILSGCVYRFR